MRTSLFSEKVCHTFIAIQALVVIFANVHTRTRTTRFHKRARVDLGLTLGACKSRLANTLVARRGLYAVFKVGGVAHLTRQRAKVNFGLAQLACELWTCANTRFNEQKNELKT
jgi:hypothetical protein